MDNVFRSKTALLSLLLLVATSVLFWFYRSNNQASELEQISSTAFHKVYFIPNPEANQLEVHLIVQSGEADLKGVEGQAHYVEHLAWLNAVGSETRLADRHSNAWTTSDATGYWLTGNSDDLDSLLATIVKTLVAPKLDRKFAEAERDIISREYDLRVRGNNYAKIEEIMDRAIYEGTPYTRSVGGIPGEIEKYSVENALAIHQQTHIPSNAVLVISGAVSSRQVKTALSKIEPNFPPKANINQKEPAPLFASYITDQSSERVEVGIDDLAPELIWRKIIRLKQPVELDWLETKVALLHDILDTNLPGGIAKPLRFDAFIAESYGLTIAALDEQFLEIRFSARPDKGVSLDQLRVAFETTLGTIAKDAIPEETFDRVLARFKTYWPDWEKPKEVADWMKNYTLNRAGDRRVPLQPNELQAINSKLKRGDINQLLAAIAGPGRVRFAEIGERP